MINVRTTTQFLLTYPIKSDWVSVIFEDIYKSPKLKVKLTNYRIIIILYYRLFSFETWPSGKAAGFGPAIRRFESYRLSFLLMII